MKTKHTAEVGETYFQHMVFAMKVSMRLLLSSCAFFAHSVLPWVPIPTWLNLQDMALYLTDRSIDRELKKDDEDRS